MLPRDRLAGRPVPLDDPRFPLAALVARIEAELEEHPEPPRRAFDRAHVEQLRQAGATRKDVARYAETLFNPRQVRALLDDLSSYGRWSGDAD